MALRSSDTIETLSKTQQRYQSLSTDDPEKANVIHTCANLQKKNTGLSGLMCEIQGSSLLNTTDMLTEEVFKGISVVKCNIIDTQAISLLQRKDELVSKLHNFMTDRQMAQNNKAGMLLEQIIPTDEGRDFWWLGQTCEIKGGSNTKDCILHDAKRGEVVFYDAFTCISRAETGPDQHETGCDQSYRDACVWEPLLHGSIGIYTQGTADGTSLFLVCISDFDQIATDIVRSMKADLGSSTNAADFCGSKEMWFLENIALRNRLRLILHVAQHLDIKVPHKTDMYAHPKQTHSDLAIECCGISLDHIGCRLVVDAETYKSVSVVQHYKDCMDITHRKCPIPIFLGEKQGLLLLLPEKANHASFANYNDTLPFVPNKTGQRVNLCPTLNICEQNRLNLQKIRVEQQNIIHITMDDLLYDLHSQGLHIPQHTRELLISTDEHGGFIFYGVQYSANTPRIIYPHVIPAFERTIDTASTATSPCNPRGSEMPIAVQAEELVNTSESGEPDIADVPRSASHGDIDKEPVLGNKTHSSSSVIMGGSSRSQQNLAETMCSSFHHHMPNNTSDLANTTTPLFDYHTQQGADDPARMSMEWGELSIGLLQRIVRMQQIDTVFLLPHVTFSNTTAC